MNIKKVLTSYLVYFVVIVLLSSCDDEKKIIGRYEFISESSINEIIYGGNEKLTIPCSVIDYKYNENFIIVKQVYFLPRECTISKKPNVYNQKKGVLYYWIINAKNDIFYGPYKNKNKFLAKIKSLHINLMF